MGSVTESERGVVWGTEQLFLGWTLTYQFKAKGF